MSQANRALIERFYAAFGRGDSAGMAACYAPDVVFGDPVFPDLRGERAGAMWRMLLSAPGDIEITLLEHDADETTGRAHWQARYVFSGTGRPVLNDVRAEFRFSGGLISEHRDRFGFHRWSRQALGPVGLLLGWTPLLRASVRRKAAGRLAKVA
ncbi:nuclear transport factor 2 family protein [Actinokineospora guangxiensis]|uniref:Nuclear transport factor 2 family protein n=1 Tax=Actinokineospora guangxiensis TaxID=1490288 RepID=A0ABW0EKV0_9PSEU